MQFPNFKKLQENPAAPFFDYCLYALDIFKSPLTLLFNKRQYISTRIGQFLSFCVIVIEMIVFLKSDFFNHQAQSIYTSNLKTNHRPLINFDKKIVAFGIQDENTMQSFLDPTVFSVEIANVYYQSNGNGIGYNKSKSNLKKTHPCQPTDFINSDENNFKNLALANSLCLEPQDNNFELEGFWDESALSIIEIRLKMCINESVSFNVSSLICKSKEEITRALNGKLFNFYYNDTIVDVKDYNIPFKPTIVNNYRYIDFKFRKNFNFFFQNIIFTHDEGYIMSEPINYYEIGFVSNDQDFYERREDDATIFSINIYADKKVQNIQRIFMRVPDLLAKMGGIMQCLLIVGSIFVNFEYSLRLKNTILNALYSFKRPKKKKKRASLMLSSLSHSSKNFMKLLFHKITDFCKEKQRVDDIKEIQNPNNQNQSFSALAAKAIHKPPDNQEENGKNEEVEGGDGIGELPEILKNIKKQVGFQEIQEIPQLPQGFTIGLTRIDYQEDNAKPNSSFGMNNWFKPPKRESFAVPKVKILKFQNFKQSSKNLYLNLLKYIRLSLKQLFPIFRMNYEERLFSKCEKIYEKDLDFVEMLKKLQDIDKLKKILLNTNQQLLFNFLMKPLVFLDISDPNMLKKAKHKYTIHLGSKALQREDEELKGAIEDFEKLAEQGMLSEVDQRIMDIVDRESSKFVKIAEDLSPRGKSEVARFPT